MNTQKKEFWNTFITQFQDYYPELYQKLNKIAKRQNLSLKTLIINNFKGLIKSFEEYLEVKNLENL